jgi:hypothetical protein
MSAVSPVPPMRISFMRCTIGFYVSRTIKYSLYLLGFILIMVYCFTGSITAILAVWLMTSLQKYCKYVVFKMFNPKKLYLDLNFMTFREQKGKYWHGEK